MMIHKFDVSSQEFKRYPFPTLRAMRDAGPVVQAKLPIVGRIWMVTSYEAVNEFLRNHGDFVREVKNSGRNKFTSLEWWLGRCFSTVAENMMAKDEPDHRRLRHLVDAAFMKRSVDDMRGRIEVLANRILDQTIAKPIDARGTIDFLEFSRRFPLAVICELLGLPEKDLPEFIRWASGFSTVNTLLGLLSLFPNTFRISRYFREQIRSCRQQPREGLLSLLVQAEHNGDSLSEKELVAMAFLLLFAGHETTTHLISNGLATLLQHSDQKTELMSDWTKSFGAVDEMMRYDCPVQFSKPRLASRDMEFFGQAIQRGESLIAMLSSANTDPQKFEDPERFNIARSPNPHLGFGTGIHVCLGMKLAVLETAIAMETVLGRFPNLEFAVDTDQIQWLTRIGMRSMKSLPIQLNGERS